MSAKVEIARLKSLIKKYDKLIEHEERLLKLQANSNAVGIGADVLAKSGVVSVGDAFTSSQQQTSPVESDELLIRRLQRCELLHKMKFQDEKIHQISSNLCKYEATGFSGPVEFHICFEVEEPSCDSDEAEFNRTVKFIDITFREPFHKTEMSMWLSNYLRNNDLQAILRSIPLYGELFAVREKIIYWLEDNYSKFFMFDVRAEVGGVLITAHSEQRNTYFEAEWKIIKYQRHQSVCHSLFFSVYESFEEPHLLGKCEDALKTLADDSTATVDSLMANWEIVANAVSGVAT